MTKEPKDKKAVQPIVLTSHPAAHNKPPLEVHWGAASAKDRGPVIASFTQPQHRNAIGTHSGSYMVYRALAVACGKLDPEHRPDLTNTAPTISIGPHRAWADPEKIVSIDPYGAMTSQVFAAEIADGFDVRPTIAITQAHMEIPELKLAIRDGRLKPDDEFFLPDGTCKVTKAAIEPVWYLPGIAKRFGVDEPTLRQSLFQHTGGMYTELITRPDLHIFLPPIGGHTVYLIGDLNQLHQKTHKITCRVHDECNGSDVFGSDICTCRPYLVHGIEMCINEAQRGGLGVIVYNRKEGRALGEVTKFLVYNARKRQAGGDTAAKYFERTECVAGVQDMRFQELMPDVLHWLGVEEIDCFVSMSDMKHDALTSGGIRIHQRVSIPDELIPQDAKVEMDAKKAAGYYSESGKPDQHALEQTKGRGLSDDDGDKPCN